MDPKADQRDPRGHEHPLRPYEPPTLSDLGSLTELTLKTNSFADGTTFGTIDIGEPTS